MSTLKKILIIEDDLDIGELQQDYLEINGYDVELQTSGKEGLKRALNKEYDLLIIDIMLPEVDGFEICKQVRAVKNIPILIVSAKKEDIDKIRGLGLGADDYIIKPFSPSELVARVKAHLARYERLIGNMDTAKKEIRIRGLVIDEMARKVYVNNQKISLTAKEFDLLLFLAQHPNRVFSKEDLFESIWGLDSSGDITTITVHIRKIRGKIENDPSNPQFIETVWGAGYMMSV
ncbi:MULTISPECIES: response regulator transcription factor [Neobacillus]|uniref:Response regulator transcription factor n=1 Tax=Neobacillus rhizophilus TaxID=2833579 RepID=A0A942U2A2_9BACI|nr:MULTISPECIES: response regulator transcription factor [Neobacillus]MBS4211538.1 response regulator transcription factor [Neobacillus rhizophilus]MBU8916955.1 response regulator transcription factor [Bacillus sp. FJAT-29953]